MYSIDWELLIIRLLPWYKRMPIWFAWLKALLKPVKDMYNEFVSYMDDVLYRLSINSQIINLEKLLNDKFNGGLPARQPSSNVGMYDGVLTGIYISDPSEVILLHYLWNKIEQRPKTYLYNKWVSGQFTSVGDFAIENNRVYKRTATGSNTVAPSISPKWVLHGELYYLRNQEEFYSQVDFVVHVPIALGDVTTDLLLLRQIRAWVDTYRTAGSRYSVVNYTP